MFVLDFFAFVILSAVEGPHRESDQPQHPHSPFRRSNIVLLKTLFTLSFRSLSRNLATSVAFRHSAIIPTIAIRQRFLHALRLVEMTRNKVLQTFGWVGGYLIVILSVAYAEPKDPTNEVPPPPVILSDSFYSFHSYFFR
jgi:hypothetical protein